jgi:hypothetical protein
MNTRRLSKNIVDIGDKKYMERSLLLRQEATRSGAISETRSHERKSPLLGQEAPRKGKRVRDKKYWDLGNARGTWSSGRGRTRWGEEGMTAGDVMGTRKDRNGGAQQG